MAEPPASPPPLSPPHAPRSWKREMDMFLDSQKPYIQQLIDRSEVSKKAYNLIEGNLKFVEDNISKARRSAIDSRNPLITLQIPPTYAKVEVSINISAKENAQKWHESKIECDKLSYHLAVGIKDTLTYSSNELRGYLRSHEGSIHFNELEFSELGREEFTLHVGRQILLLVGEIHDANVGVIYQSRRRGAYIAYRDSLLALRQEPINISHHTLGHMIKIKEGEVRSLTRRIAEMQTTFDFEYESLPIGTTLLNFDDEVQRFLKLLEQLQDCPNDNDGMMEFGGTRLQPLRLRERELARTLTDLNENLAQYCQRLKEELEKQYPSWRIPSLPHSVTNISRRHSVTRLCQLCDGRCT